jgi:transporter family protein
MWLFYALSAMGLLVMRRGTEKNLADKVPSSAMAWLQQFCALPFMALMLPFATWYNLVNLSGQFKMVLAVYAIVGALDLIFYYKAIQVGDISIIAPLINLTTVSSILGSFIILGQKPSGQGMFAALLVIVGAYLVAKRKHASKTALDNRLAILLILGVVLMRGIYSPLEVIAIRETNPIYFNFISSLFAVPLVMLIMLVRQKGKVKKNYTKDLQKTIIRYRYPLLFIGLTMAFNMFFTYSAKINAPNAGYVTAIKGAQVVPMVLIGRFFFNERVSNRQYLGVVIIVAGLILFGLS